jgi:pimeloyl-ACP methyl ester carboxylesterase
MQQVTSADGTRIAFEKLGSGPPLLLISGALNDRMSRNAGVPLARLLSTSHTVIAYDRRGRGSSGDTPPYAIVREVEDVAALLSILGGRPHVYGHSSGGLIALEAVRAGLPVGKLALYEPPLALGEGRAPLPPDLVDQLRRLVEQGDRSAAVALFLTRAVGIPEQAVHNMTKAPYWPGLAALAHTLSYDALLAEDPQAVLNRAGALQLPTLVLDGERSPPWMRLAVERLAAAIPGARRQSLPGQNHDVDPGELAPKLYTFFRAE